MSMEKINVLNCSFKVFSSYSVDSLGFDKTGTKVKLRTKVVKRVNDVLIDLVSAYNLFCSQAPGEGANFQIIATTGHLDMFGKIVSILEKNHVVIPTSMKTIEVDGRNGMYNLMQVTGVLDPMIVKLPSLEALLAKDTR